MTGQHALIIGKFLPPHLGHDLLVRTAAATCDRVSVLVLAHPDEPIPLQDRVRWLTATVADLGNVIVAGGMDPHPIDDEDPAIWDLHVAEFRSVLASVTDEPVTAVFSSEPYGEELARRFGARPVCVDLSRQLAPVSGTAVRADPIGTWEHLPTPTRAGLCLRVVVVGAESTGTTTVSRAVVDRLRARGGAHGLTRWVPEHGRDATVTKLARARAEAALAGHAPPAMDDLTWSERDFVEIATEQDRLEDEAAALGGPVLVCDTDAFATGIWHERYRGGPSSEVSALARHHPLYLLTHHDGVPFEQDGIRDGEHVRSWMTGRFEEALVATDRHHVVLTGPLDGRVECALAAIDDLIDRSWPIGGRP